MFDYETSITGIEFKVRQLADEISRLRCEVREKENRCHELEEALENKEILIKNLNEQNRLIKLGNRLTDKGDSAEIKLRINQMIRTIDKSIEILKKEV